jgi:uncharacterized protein YqeY
MSLELKINEGIKAAMLAKDKVRLESMRAVKAAILLAKTAENAQTLDEASEMKMLRKLVKQRRESAEVYTNNNRPELAEKETAEADIIEELLPKQMSAEAIEEAVKALVAELGATSPKDIGKVTGAATKLLAGKAEGKEIAETVKKLLQ